MSVIAIDGPAASGKGTLARKIAAHLGYQYLDTGMLYRAVALHLLQNGEDPDDEALAIKAARAVNLTGLSSPELRAEGTGDAASRVAALPGVRAAILDLQRNFAGMAPGTVLDGRDIGTVVCPDARVKLFVVARPDVRARRRFKEMTGRGLVTTYAGVLDDIARRDARDQSRAVAPLRPAPDAHLLDTSELDIEAAFQAALQIIAKANS